jgi:tetratricopeptide (TPR) repeat protein
MRIFTPVVIGLLIGASDGRASLADAESAYRLGEREEARHLARSLLDEDSEAARSARVLALLARTARDPAEAMSVWDEVIALEPRGALAAEAHFEKGLHAYSAGLYVGAAQEFRTLVEGFASDFDRGRALFWKGQAELGADLPEQAFESFRMAERSARDPLDAAGAELGAANACFRLGNLREALNRFERFTRSRREDPRAGAAARSAVECLKLLGREAEAEARAQEIAREHPESFEATLARAEVRRPEDHAAPGPGEESASREGRFVVQVAAMADPRNAAALREAIRGLGIQEIRVERGEGPEGPVHRVILGPFHSEEQARAIADSVATLGDFNPRIRPEAQEP